VEPLVRALGLERLATLLAQLPIHEDLRRSSL
jgi:hypothetical protein